MMKNMDCFERAGFAVEETQSGMALSLCPVDVALFGLKTAADERYRKNFRIFVEFFR